MTDFTVRCIKCSIGVDQTGGNVGAPLAAFTVSCQITNTESIAVAEYARCINVGGFHNDGTLRRPCEQIYSLKLLPSAHQYGITKAGVLKCIRNSRGNLFTLNELKDGELAMNIMPREKINPPPDYNESAEVDDEGIF